jgi:hypothetical protein
VSSRAHPGCPLEFSCGNSVPLPSRCDLTRCSPDDIAAAAPVQTKGVRDVALAGYGCGSSAALLGTVMLRDLRRRSVFRLTIPPELALDRLAGGAAPAPRGPLGPKTTRRSDTAADPVVSAAMDVDLSRRFGDRGTESRRCAEGLPSVVPDEIRSPAGRVKGGCSFLDVNCAPRLRPLPEGPAMHPSRTFLRGPRGTR